MKGEHNKIYEESKILYEIYRMRGLTIAQLVEVVFKSKVYAYRYLKKLEEKGWLNYAYDTDGKKRLAKVYFCTDKAIERLEEEGFIEQGVKAKDNKPPKMKLKYTVHTNEVYAALTPCGIHMYDSREWKNRNRMDRNNLVRGGLRMVDGREYALYLFFSNEQIEGAGLSEATLKRFMNEIKTFPQTNKFIILCYNREIYSILLKAVEEDKQILGMGELLIIPVGKEDFGINLIKIMRNEEEQQEWLELFLNARLYKEHQALRGNAEHFAHYVAEFEDKESYIVNFLSMNRPVLHHLNTLYYETAYNQNGRDVQIICWKGNEDELKQKFIQYPHVNIVSISNKTLIETLIPKIESKKLI